MKVKVYERYEDDGKVVENVHEMWAVDAREAVHNGGGRYSTTPFADGKKKPAEDPIGDELKVVHRGRGSYSVMQGNKELHDGLTKDEAEKKLAELTAA